MNILEKQRMAMAEKQREVGEKRAKEGMINDEFEDKSLIMNTKEDMVISWKKKEMMKDEQEAEIKCKIILETIKRNEHICDSKHKARWNFVWSSFRFLTLHLA